MLQTHHGNLDESARLSEAVPFVDVGGGGENEDRVVHCRPRDLLDRHPRLRTRRRHLRVVPATGRLRGET